MNTFHHKKINDLMCSEAEGINKCFKKDNETGIIALSASLERWIDSFTNKIPVKNNIERMEYLETFSRGLLSNIDDDFKESAKFVLSHPYKNIDELFQDVNAETPLFKQIKSKTFRDRPSWTKEFNKNILDDI